MSRGPKNRSNGGSGRRPGGGYVAGTRPPSPPPPDSGAGSVFSCLLLVAFIPLFAVYALAVGIVRRL